ncbi:unnamed protein product [Brassicogethes aeneus]|uniref:Phosphatidylinositol N-acetylglucosaminyltransferase subunit Q n=1 Tax=Brassicogethes aeneus TaxID=1431903 RepID=A0A9P0BHW6_BRAAE|nr:unnamed protein product [Brassicogethes aeneus]
MKPKNIFIFTPNALEKDKNGYLEGFHKKYADNEAYFITNSRIKKQCTKFVGYAGKNRNIQQTPNTISIENGKITVNGTNLPLVNISYDYHAFKDSRVIDNTLNIYGKFFNDLKQYYVDKNNSTNGRKSVFVRFIDLLTIYIGYMLILLDKCKFFVPFFATLTHFEQSLTTLLWFFEELKGKKLTLKAGNVLMAKIIDLVVGVVLMYYCINHQIGITIMFKNWTQEVVEQLKSLLLCLMGSPIGLKLNYAFNQSLGKFFFYHITLWKVFLNGLHPLIEQYFKCLLFPCLFGFTFQIAMLYDVISISTFHVYCIYVYAARMFNLQVKCLISLWRLFMGRKFNPLRNRVDSCQYEQNQLFIGTLGFTVFLFLLPTTTMYYTVFVSFRIIIKIVETLFSKLRHILNVLPLYGLSLWIFNSNLVAGSLYIKCVYIEKNDVTLEAKLNKLSLGQIFDLTPKITKKNKFNLGEFVHNVFTGVLI